MEHKDDAFIPEIEGDRFNWFWVCGNCHCRINWHDKKCSCCGKDVNWDE